MSRKYTAILVDDEKASRVSLRSFIQSYCPQIELLGEAVNIEEAAYLIAEHDPEILFLDIEMPHGNGFDLLDKYQKPKFQVIFVTAFSHYAMKALKLAAAQYLLKPIDINELEQAVHQVCQNIDEEKKWEHTVLLLENIKSEKFKKIVIPLMTGFEVVDPDAVFYIEADDNFSIIHLKDRKPLMACRKLKFYEENLSEAGFYRVHRSTIVNLNHVVKYTKGKAAFVTLSNGKEVDISLSRKSGFVEKFLG